MCIWSKSRNFIVFFTILHKTLFNSTKTTPRILIMPDYLDIFRADLFPPFFKLLARNVKRRRRDEVIKNDVVLLAPAECAEMIEIVVVKKAFGKRFSGFVERFVNQF